MYLIKILTMLKLMLSIYDKHGIKPQHGSESDRWGPQQLSVLVISTLGRGPIHLT